MNNKTLVIVPAFNEEKNIARIVREIRGNIPEAGVVVVDDGSSDSTKENAHKSGAVVISLPFNMGYGTAVQTGYKYAKSEKHEYILQLDADGQHEPLFLKDILSELRKDSADVIIGSRFLHQASYRPRLLRLIGMKLFSALTSLLLGQKISDPTSGFLGFKGEVLGFLVSDFFPFDYPDADTIIMMRKAGFRIKEIPVVMRAGNRKSMHSGIRPLYYVFKMLLSILTVFLRGGGKNAFKA